MAHVIANQTARNGAEIMINRTPKNAYVTFLAGDGDYVKGVIGLAKGLRKVKAAFPLVVAVLTDVPVEHRRVLVEQGCVLRDIELVLPVSSGKESPFARVYFAINYCKLRLWEFVEYNKMIYMDADIQVFNNIDHLFDLPSGHFYGVVDCLCDMYDQPCPKKITWPKELGKEPPFYFNGGMFIFEPSLETYNGLLNTYKVTPPTPFAEQDFLNMYFRDISRPLPPVYNLLVAMLWRHPQWANLVEVKVVHYCVAGSKPWKYTGEGEYMDRADIKMLVKKWWDIYNDPSLDFDANADADKKMVDVLKNGKLAGVSLDFDADANANADKKMVDVLKNGKLAGVSLDFDVDANANKKMVDVLKNGKLAGVSLDFDADANANANKKMVDVLKNGKLAGVSLDFDANANKKMVDVLKNGKLAGVSLDFDADANADKKMVDVLKNGKLADMSLDFDANANTDKKMVDVLKNGKLAGVNTPVSEKLVTTLSKTEMLLQYIEASTIV